MPIGVFYFAIFPLIKASSVFPYQNILISLVLST
jgi:hypothetical protein